MVIPTPELNEVDFINEGYTKNRKPLWTWLLVLLACMSIIWMIGSGYYSWMRHQISRDPFLQVTNRELSLFLWQFPEHMRNRYSGNRSAYLPAFKYEAGAVSLDLTQANDYVSAPPELLFLYHTWNRLLKNESLFSRPITLAEFKEFLNRRPEWLPQNWPDATPAYAHFVESLTESSALLAQPEDVLPFEVKLAFQGWKNFFKDGESINEVVPTFGEMQRFLEGHPHYARNYWRNLVYHQTPQYLLANFEGKGAADAPLPQGQLTSFLKVGFFNYKESLEGR